jgi:hypothetical protein
MQSSAEDFQDDSLIIITLNCIDRYESTKILQIIVLRLVTITATVCYLRMCLLFISWRFASVLIIEFRLSAIGFRRMTSVDDNEVYQPVMLDPERACYHSCCKSTSHAVTDEDP